MQAIANIKEADSSLQAKVWIRLARASTNVLKQFNAYNKAIEILSKEQSVELVEVKIEFSDWLLRNNYGLDIIVENLQMSADMLLDIEYKADSDDEEDLQQEDGKSHTVFSRSSRGKKSIISKK